MIVFHFFACSPYQPQRLKVLFVGAGHKYVQNKIDENTMHNKDNVEQVKYAHNERMSLHIHIYTNVEKAFFK